MILFKAKNLLNQGLLIPKFNEIFAFRVFSHTLFTAEHALCDLLKNFFIINSPSTIFFFNNSFRLSKILYCFIIYLLHSKCIDLQI